MAYPYLDQPNVFRITFKPAGAKSRRSVFARLIRETDKLMTWSVLKKDGDASEPLEVIITTPSEVTRRPVRMNLHYGEFEVIPERKEGG